MPEHFIRSFAKRLDNDNELKVKVAEKGEVLKGQTVYLMPGDTNTKVVRDINSDELTFAFTSKKFPEFNNPSVDCLFDSLNEAT